MKKLSRVMGASITNLGKARYSRQQRDAEHLERMLKEVMHPGDAARLAAAYAARVPDPRAAKEEPFIMMTATQNAAVVRYLHDHSKRPQAASRLWAELFTAVHPATGEVMLTRQELAERVGIEPKHVSSIMTELVSINAVMRRKEGRRVIYAMNPAVATHIPGPEARKEAREKAGPLLTVMEGGRTDG